MAQSLKDEIINQKNFLSKNSIDGGFLQSDIYGQVKQAENFQVFSFDDKGSFRALVILHQLPLVGNYFFLPRGPIFDKKISEADLEKQLFQLMEKAKELNIGWLRIEPQSTVDWIRMKKIFEKKYQIVKSKKNHEPIQTLILNLDKTLEKLLAEMKPKTRYNLRLAEKKGVKIVFSKEKAVVEDFLALLEVTAKRDGIKNHNKCHYRKLIEVGGESVELVLGKVGNETVCGAILILFGNRAIYLHGASSNRHREKMATYLLQWEMIKLAQKRGCRIYDFFGVKVLSQKDEKGEYQPLGGSWKGITRFKLGFSPTEGLEEYPGCYDVILNKKKYFLYRIIQKLKSLF